jgi:hypothetical protein
VDFRADLPRPTWLVTIAMVVVVDAVSSTLRARLV